MSRAHKRQSLPSGTHTGRSGRRRKLGSLINGADAERGRNFLSPAIAFLARREIAYQERGALIERGRLFGNLLSSAGLTFNAFAPMRFDKALAAKVLRAILPTRDIAVIERVLFEHSPGRLNTAYCGDRSAFDVAIVYRTNAGLRGLLGIEIKYSESLTEGSRGELPAHYDTLAPASGLYKEPYNALLRVPPLQQLFREHLLAHTTLMRGDYDEASFVLIAPDANHLAQRASDLYAAFMTGPAPDRANYFNVTLEQLVQAYGWAGATEHALALHDRYLDWRKVDDAVETALQDKVLDWRVAPPPSQPIALIGRAA